MYDCEFCQEIAGSSPRFEKVYRHLASTRIVARTDHFVALPTLGQLFAGSLLLLPVNHVETCAGLASDVRRELHELAEAMVEKVSVFGEPVLFEHGATEPSGGGCGIYHAHLHVVPLPEVTSAAALFPERQAEASNLEAAWERLQGSREYLLMSSAGQTLYSDLDSFTARYPSQFFRRRIAEHFGLSTPWDWRAYTEAEPSLLRTLNATLPAHAS